VPALYFMLPHWFEALLKLLTQFTGARGGVDHIIVNYGMAAIFYAGLLAIATAKYRDDPQPREALLRWGFAFGLGRELFMIFMAILNALGIVTPAHLHEVFPPFEHFLLCTGLIIIAASFLLYLLDDEALSRKYLQLGIAAAILVYLITAIAWPAALSANPKITFGKTWCDMLWHANAALWLVIAAVPLALRAQSRIRNIVLSALGLFFLYHFLKIPDNLTHEVYEYIFAPIRVSLYLIAILVLGYVYVREQAEDRKKQKQNLQNLVQSRTQELSVALEDLSAKNERLQEVDQVKSEFLATMSHELRTPLNSILGFTGLVQQGVAGPINAEQGRQLGMAYGSAKHLLDLINDILDLSRIEAGRMELLIEPIDMHQIMTEATHSMEPMLAQKKLRLNLNVSAAIGVVHGDYKKIMQVLLNLLNNAVKFTDFGEITLSCQPDATGLVVSVSDTGCGIRQESIPVLFNAFRQIESEDDREYGGTGLGLYLCQKLVHLMGGKIGVKSEYGVGSTFSFNLPTQATTPAGAA
jgi:signal transduction histidine kinase